MGVSGDDAVIICDEMRTTMMSIGVIETMTHLSVMTQQVWFRERATLYSRRAQGSRSTFQKVYSSFIPADQSYAPRDCRSMAWKRIC